MAAILSSGETPTPVSTTLGGGPQLLYAQLIFHHEIYLLLTSVDSVKSAGLAKVAVMAQNRNASFVP